MSARASACAALLDGPEPLTGNRFVATYPPFSCWSPEGAAAFRRALERPAADAPPLGLYVHVPFCVERCQYCYYLSRDDRRFELERYVDALTTELALLAGMPAVAGRALDFVYFGGGTPSLLPVALLERLFAALGRAFPLGRVRELSFECAPRSVTAEKLAALRALGVTRVSLGVQSFDDEVLRLNGRVHLREDVERALALLEEARFEVRNLDLMVGLVGERAASFEASLERALQHAPESLTVYQLEVPLNTPLARALAAGGLGAPPPSWEEKRARLGRGFARLEAAGYTVRSAYTAVRDPARHRFVYQDEQYAGADLLGVGCSAFSYFAGAHQQNTASLEGYLAAVERGELPLGRGLALSARERATRELVLQLKLGRVDRARFRARHGVDLAEGREAELAGLAARGLATLDAAALTLTRAGLLRADRLLPALYLPEHRGLRYS